MNIQEAITLYKSNPQVAEQANQHLQDLLSRSASDQTFRRKLLSEPRAALSEHFGREIPESVNLAFVENRGDATIVLPPFVDPNVELSDAELETVAGGVVWLPVVAAILTCIAVGTTL